MKYFKDIDILYEIFYIISKHCSISNNNVDTVIKYNIPILHNNTSIKIINSFNTLCEFVYHRYE